MTRAAQGADVRIAAIDLGTVSSRLSLVCAYGGALSVAQRHSVITDMGQGVDATGRFQAEAIERVVVACRAFVEEARAFEAELTCVTLTSAARDADNAEELLDALRALGLVPQVIPGTVEARLTFYGVAHDFPGERIAVADPGGGSTEIVTGAYDPATPQLLLETVESLNVGCRRLSDRYFTASPPRDAELAAASAWVHEQFAAYWRACASLPERLVSVGGSATTLVAMTHELEPYDSSFVHLRRLSIEEVARQLDRMKTLTIEEIAQLKGVQPQRAPMMVAGSLIMRELMRAGGYGEVTVSESSLLAGVAYTVAEACAGLDPVIGWTPVLSRGE